MRAEGFPAETELVAHHCSASSQHHSDLCHSICRHFDSGLSSSANLFPLLFKPAHLSCWGRTQSSAPEPWGRRAAVLLRGEGEGLVGFGIAVVSLAMLDRMGVSFWP